MRGERSFHPLLFLLRGSSYIMEQIIRATLRDALRVRCEQRNNLADDGSPMGMSIVCELPANSGAIEHPRDHCPFERSGRIGAQRSICEKGHGKRSAFVLKHGA